MTTPYIVYGTPVAITISPENVASSSNWTAGVESTAEANTGGTPYVDALISGFWTCGTTPTTNTQCKVFVYAQHDDTPTYQDVFDGTASAETVTSAGVLAGVVRELATMLIDSTTSNRTYYVAPTSLAALFGGHVPKRWGLFIAHNSGVNSNSTAGNHGWKYTPINYAF